MFFGGKYLEYSRHALKIGVGLGRKVLGLFLKGWGGRTVKAVVRERFTPVTRGVLS